MEASIFHKLIGKFIKPTNPYTPSLLTQILHKATATKLVTARLLRDSLTDTLSNPTNPSNIRLYNTEEQIFVCSSFYTLLSLKLAFLWNFPHSKMSKMEAEMETKMEAFHCRFIISKKPILANRLFVLFAELLRLVEKYGNISEPWVVSHWSDKVN